MVRGRKGAEGPMSREQRGAQRKRWRHHKTVCGSWEMERVPGF